MLRQPLAVKLFTCLFSAALLCGCVPYGSTTYRYSSPVRAKIGRSNSAPKIRASILEVMPVGTPRVIVEQRIKENFHAPIVADNLAIRTYRKSHPDWSSFEVHLYTRGLFPAGHDDAEARFLFDQRDKLQDVVIFQGGAWL